MSGTVHVTIDGRVVEVAAGTLVTDAAHEAGVHIPVFCAHAKLPPLGACRICVVEIGMPRLGPDRKPVTGPDGAPEIAWMPKPQTACTTPVAEGMAVRTESPAAIKARQGVMEFLLVNHPLDCPVCDEGGECALQDLAFAFGADFSRMDEAKRTFVSEDLGPVVKKEANRCIVCMRCVRYCDEIMGDDALTVHQRGVRSEISSFDRMPLDCEQCGNCIEVCPVGALTALPYRFKARPWDLRQQVTICPWCSNGCTVRLGVRGTEILRARGTERRGVNQEYLCVRGRFGYEFVGDAERLTRPLLRLGAALEPAGFEEAVSFAAARLRGIAATHGPGAIAFLGGEKLLVEEQYLFQKLARGVLGTNHIDARTRWTASVPGDAVLRATGGGRPLASFDEVGRAAEVLVLGDDLQGESPFVQAVLVRGQHQHGVHLTIAHPRRVKLAREKFGGDWLGYRPGSEAALLAGLASAAIEHAAAGAPPEAAAAIARVRGALAAWTPDAIARATGLGAETIAAAARRLAAAPTKAILFGRALTEHPEAAALLSAVEALGWASGAVTAARSSVLYLGPQNNTQGAFDAGLLPDQLPGYQPVADAAARARFAATWGGELPSTSGLAAPAILEAAAAGRIKALWIVSDHWLKSCPDRALAERALAGCELVIVSDLFLTPTAARAHVVFPAASFAEKDGVAVNAERRLQRAARAILPRTGARTDFEIFSAVAKALGAAWPHRGPEEVFRELARLSPAYHGTSWATLLPLGPMWSLATPLARGAPGAAGSGEAGSTDALPAAAAGPSVNGDGLALLSGGTLFLQGSLAHRGTLLPKLAKRATAAIHPDEARRLGVGEGETLRIEGPAGALELPARLDPSVPPGSVFVPYAFAEVELNRLGAGPGARVRARAAGARATVGA